MLQHILRIPEARGRVHSLVADFSFAALIKIAGFDHIDFGCSKGGSLLFAQRRLGGRKGLGIDVRESKVKATRAAGFAAVTYDIHKIPDIKLVRFTVMSHFLEHIPSASDVRAFVRKACLISKEFVYIQQPFFDADDYLANKGLKLFWSDWTGHPNRMTSLQIHTLLSNLQKEGLPINYSIHFRTPIVDSDDVRIHPAASPKDQHDYDSSIHPKKEVGIEFEDEVFAETVCLITMSETDHDKVLQGIKVDRTAFRSDALRPDQSFPEQ